MQAHRRGERQCERGVHVAGALMLREDPARSHVRARREDVVAIYESANQPMVQIPGRAAQAAQAAVVAVRKGRAFEVLVVLTFTEARENVVYAGDAPVPQDELQAANEDEELPQPHNAVGLLYAYSLARPQDAEREFKRAIELDKDFSEARNNLGAFYMARARYPEAIPQFELALSNALYRDRVIAESNLGWALYKAGQQEKGVRRIEAALLVAPKYCLGWRQLGTIHAERGELPAATDAFAKYAAACPDVADAHLQAGKILARQTRAAEARLEFQRCAGSKDEREAGIARECQRLLPELSP